ncbi:MAG: hypothetical protein ACFCGT_03430 [Sandaracinaceae bacterium]
MTEWVRKLGLAMCATGFVLGLAACSNGGATGEICRNGCAFRNDGDCDDGAAGSDFSLCAYGSDCDDCGPRPAGSGEGCTNTCASSGDGECDDGGRDSLFDICPLGTDCDDCGPR